jgi:hypothetical protein
MNYIIEAFTGVLFLAGLYYIGKFLWDVFLMFIESE